MARSGISLFGVGDGGVSTFKFLVLLLFPFLAGCDGMLPAALSESDRPIYKKMGGEDYAVPLNYTLGGEKKNSAFIIASWPEMNGRTNDTYLHWTQSHISIGVGEDLRPGAVQRALDLDFRIKILDPRGAKLPMPEGQRFGFKYSTMQKFDYQELYERFQNDGSRSAFMMCSKGNFVRKDSGENLINDNCELRAIYPEFQKLILTISFKKPKNIQDVLVIEKSVKILLNRFRTDGAKARAEGKIHE